MLQKWAEAVSPYDVTAYLLLAAAVMTLIFGLIRNRRAFWRSIPGVLYIVFSSSLFLPWLGAKARLFLAIPAGAALLTHLILHRVDPAPPEDNSEAKPSRTPLIYLMLLLLVGAVFLFCDLGGFAGTLLVWESPVSQEFGNTFHENQDVFRYAARQFLWDDGLMSSGQKSLLYGAPTYALLKTFGFHPWTLRVFSVLATLLSVVTAYGIGRRFYGARIGVALAVLLALNVSVLFYGRYGTLSAATLLTSLLAIYCTWLFLDHRRPRWWMGPLCAMALYLATLHYATARLLVIVLLAAIPIVLACQWRSMNWKRLLGFILIGVCVLGVWQMQKHFGAHKRFHEARGEQFLNFLKSPAYFKQFTGRTVQVHQMTRFDKFELLYRVLETTIPQYLWFVSPQRDLSTRGILGSDPPRIPLYFAPVAPFLLWGLGHSLFRWRRWRYAIPLAWVVLATGPLLLTNRVDAHRIMLFVVPLSMWAAFGVGRAAVILKQARVPIALQHGLAAALALILLWNHVTILFWDKPPASRGCEVIAAELEKIPGPLVAGLQMDHREVSLVNLALLERTRRDREQTSRLMQPRLLNRINEGPRRGQPVPGPYVSQLQMLLNQSSLILAPSSRFSSVGIALTRRGYKVHKVSRGGFSFLYIGRGEPQAQAGVPAWAAPEGAEPLRMLPEWNGTKIWLDQLNPRNVRYEFAEPKANRTWNNAPIVMDDITYSHGIGTHAWCEMTYAVPEGALAFQAMIGFSDQVRNHPEVEVSFEVLNDRQVPLYNSGIVTPARKPIPIIVDLKGVKQVTLMVTEGRDGRGHDHANWGDAAFLLPPPK